MSVKSVMGTLELFSVLAKWHVQVRKIVDTSILYLLVGYTTISKCGSLFEDFLQPWDYVVIDR